MWRRVNSRAGSRLLEKSWGVIHICIYGAVTVTVVVTLRYTVRTVGPYSYPTMRGKKLQFVGPQMLGYVREHSMKKMNRTMGGINFRAPILLCYVSHRRCCCRLLSSSTTGILTPIIQSYQLCNVTKDEHRAAKLSFFIRDSPFIFLRRHASICNCIGCALLLHLYIDIYIASSIQHPHPSTVHPEESSFEWS